MYGLQLLEMAHISEQEHMNNALMARARREARRGRRHGTLFGRIVRRRS